MKLLLTIYCCLLCAVSFGQRKDTNAVKQKSTSQMDTVKIHLIRNQDSIFLKNKKDDSIDIPTVKPDSQIAHTTPIRKLSGKGLSPMPGTDSLDSQKSAFDSVYSPKIIIKTAPFIK